MRTKEELKEIINKAHGKPVEFTWEELGDVLEIIMEDNLHEEAEESEDSEEYGEPVTTFDADGITVLSDMCWAIWKRHCFRHISEKSAVAEYIWVLRHTVKDPVDAEGVVELSDFCYKAWRLANLKASEDLKKAVAEYIWLLRKVAKDILDDNDEEKEEN